ALLAVILITIFQSVAYFQLFNVAPVWMQAHVAAELSGLRIPIPWYQSASALTSMLAVPLLFWIWRWQARHQGERDDLSRISTGAWLAAASNLILVLGIYLGGDGRISALWALCYAVVLGVAFLFYWPTLLALISQTAPARVNATLMGIGYLSLFIANLLVGWIGGLYERMSPMTFWSVHAAIGAAGSLAVVLFGARIRSRLRTPS
ncbi:MAG: hypothetical protein JOY91_16560, partial [Sinobacteraceae bacterium]|nr:hypothetical protein [Nevskiaceae bacterium]